MRTHTPMIILTAISLGAVVSACGGSGTARQTPEAATPAPSAVTQARADKPVAPVEIRHIVSTGEGDGVVSVRLTLTARAGAGLEVAIEPDSDAVQLLTPSTAAFEGARLSTPVSLDVLVAVLQPGTHYLNVTATLVDGDTRQARSVAIPVSTGGKEGATQRADDGALKTTPDGRRLHVAPAEEDRSPSP